MFRFERVAVTGAAGLIGGAVSRKLSGLGVEVIPIDLPDVDVAEPRVADVLDAARPQAVLHAAAHPGGKSLAEPIDDVRVNALGSMRVFEWCARANVPVIYTSSSAVYGDQPAGGIREDAPVKPGTVYAGAKIACEHWLNILGHGYGLPWTVLRLFATYGAGHKPNTFQGILNVMLTQLLSGDRVVVKGSLERERDLLYVDDAAAAIVKAFERDAARGQIINVGTGIGVTIRQIIEAICHELGRPLSGVSIVEEAGTVGDSRNSVADISRARLVLGFEPAFMLADGLRTLLRERAPHY